MMFLEFNKMVRETLVDISYDPSFKSFIMEVLTLLEKDALAIEQASTSNIPEYHEYTKRLIGLLSVYCESEDGVLKMNGTKVNIKEGMQEEYVQKITELITTYEKALMDRQKESEAVADLLKGTVEISLPSIHKEVQNRLPTQAIPFNVIPKEVSEEQMKFLNLLMGS